MSGIGSSASSLCGHHIQPQVEILRQYKARRARIGSPRLGLGISDTTAFTASNAMHLKANH